MVQKLRYLLRSLFAGALYHSGLLTPGRLLRSKARNGDGVCVLAFHRILPDEEFTECNSLPGVVMRESTFAALLEYLQEHFRFIQLDDLGAADPAPSRPRCLITFDDGWRDNYTRAYPWLRRYGVPAAIFLATGFIGQKECFWAERLVKAWKEPAERAKILEVAAQVLPEAARTQDLSTLVEYLKHMSHRERQLFLDPLNARLASDAPDARDEMLTWDEIIEMSHDGITFGAHTVTHPLLTHEDDEAVDRELRTSRQVVEKAVNKPARAFAYPNGDWDARIREKVCAAGYEWAFTTVQGWYSPQGDRYTIRRISLHEGSVANHRGKFSPAILNLTLARSR